MLTFSVIWLNLLGSLYTNDQSLLLFKLPWHHVFLVFFWSLLSLFLLCCCFSSFWPLNFRAPQGSIRFPSPIYTPFLGHCILSDSFKYVLYANSCHTYNSNSHLSQNFRHVYIIFPFQSCYSPDVILEICHQISKPAPEVQNQPRASDGKLFRAFNDNKQLTTLARGSTSLVFFPLSPKS